MTNYLLELAVSNLCFSLLLALVAWGVHRTGRRPVVAHLLWTIVLIKLVTPPILTVPVLPAPVSEAMHDTNAIMAGAASFEKLAPDTAMHDVAGAAVNAQFWKSVQLGLILFWACGSVGVMGWSLVRVFRFNRLLSLGARPASNNLQAMADRTARRMGLPASPRIHTTTARISPMVWWFGGRVRMVIPAALLDKLEDGQLRWILAHELAHVKRHDHVIRWLEWLACVGFWWNPVAWWSRRNLRINEEICCDAMVLSSMQAAPREYASSLLTVVEYLASPVIRPPAVASEINSGGFLERRFKMIIAESPMRKTSRGTIVAILLSASVFMPLGIVHAEIRKETHDDGIEHARQMSREEYHQAELKIKDAVDAGELTEEEAHQKLLAMREAMGMHKRGVWRHMAGVLMESGVSREQVRDVLGVVKKLAADINAEGDDFVLDPAVEEDLYDMGLTDKQVELAVGIAHRMAAHMDENKDHEQEMWRHVEEALTIAGVDETSMRTVMGLIKRIAHEMIEEGEEFELSPDISASLAELELNDEQTELTLGIARRIAHHWSDERARERQHGHERIIHALLESGVVRENLEGVMGAVERIIHEMRAEGDAFELDEGLAEYLAGLGLTGEQIDLVLEIAGRLANAHDEGEAGKERRMMHERIVQALLKQEIPRVNIEPVMKILHPIMKEIREEGDEFELDPAIEEKLVALELTNEQIDFVVGLAHRIVAHHDSQEKSEGRR